MQNSPIGIFDSGIGGLTIAYSLKKILPKESFIYFGDTKHLPYGEKSEKAIKHYSLKIALFLKSKNCKAIVIACNSASAVAFDHIKKNITDIPIYNVIDPVIEKITEECTSKEIGVIGTKATIESSIYKEKIHQYCNKISVKSHPTPLLAPMIEEGFINQEISKSIITKYLTHYKLKNINSLILGCTHYPLIKNEIIKFYNNKLEVIDSSEIVSQSISKDLGKSKLIAKTEKPIYHFIVSNYTKSFEKSAYFFFKESIKLEEVDIWV